MKNVADIYPLTPVQLGMLFHTLANPTTGVYVNQYACELQGTVQPEVLRQAWQATIDRHPALRTAVLWEGLDDPLQVVRQQVDVPWQVLDWRDRSPSDQKAALTDWLQRDRDQGFDLAQAPVMRLTLITLSETTHQFVWSYHHLLLDGWSLVQIWQDVLVHYSTGVAGNQPHLPQCRPYRDYIAWQQNQDLIQAETFWRQQLQTVSEPTPLPAARTGGSTTNQSYRRQSRQFSAAFVDHLKALGRSHRLTLNTLVQGAWALLLHHFSDRTQVTYGSVVSGRPASLTGVESMVGLFINTLPIAVQITPDQSLIPWLQARQQQLLDVCQYDATPLTSIQQWSHLPTGVPLFESIVAFENLTTPPAPPLPFQPTNPQYIEQSNYPLALLVYPNEGLDVALLYDPGCFEDAAIARLLDHLDLLLTAFIDHPHTALGALPRLTASEIQALSATTTEKQNAGWALPTKITTSPSNACPTPEQEQNAGWALPTKTNTSPTRQPRNEQPDSVISLIETQVSKTPDAPAVSCEERTLTYRELNRRANQIAHALRSRGIAPGDLVVLCLSRSVEMVVGILGILKAGAAYVPLDPTYPLDRLDYCLQDIQPQLVLTQRSVTLPPGNWPTLHLAPRTPEIDKQPVDNPEPFASPKDLAYIIYTSGSTGQPKGVMISHRNLVHSTTARFQVYPAPVERFLLLSSIAFDSSVAGLFWPLCQGGQLVISPHRIEQDLRRLASLIEKNAITHTLCIPALYALLLDTVEPQQLRSLHTVIVAGEACPRTLAQQHHITLPDTHLYNEYGPTEATVWCTAYRIPPDLPSGPVPIGYPIPNTPIYLLNSAQQPVPTGAIGQLHVGGPGVTQGYWQQPEKTAQAFIPRSDIPSCPPSPVPLYNTGDLARYRPDGTLEWLGRRDRQVKIRGHRIELGEIEDVLRSHNTVTDAVVVPLLASPFPLSPSPVSVETLITQLVPLPPDQAQALLDAVEEHSP